MGGCERPTTENEIEVAGTTRGCYVTLGHTGGRNRKGENNDLEGRDRVTVLFRWSDRVRILLLIYGA